MTDAAKPTVLLAPGLGGLRGLLEGQYAVLDQPAENLEAFARSEGQAVRAIVTTGSRPVEPALAALPDLGLVAVIGSGYEQIDVEAHRRRKVEVTHSPNANHDDVADHAMGLFIGLARQIVAGDRRLRDGGWIAGRHPRPMRSLSQMKVGIVGLGAIGLAIAKRLEPFGCAIAWCGPNPKAVAYPRAESLMALARDSDVLMIALRADDRHRGLISTEVIEALGPQGIVVNIARGLAIDEDALIAALKAGKLGGAALDVFETEPTPPERWRDVPNVVLTPHTGGGGTAALAAMTGLVMENLRRFFAGEPLATPVPRG